MVTLSEYEVGRERAAATRTPRRALPDKAMPASLPRTAIEALQAPIGAVAQVTDAQGSMSRQGLELSTVAGDVGARPKVRIRAGKRYTGGGP